MLHLVYLSLSLSLSSLSHTHTYFTLQNSCLLWFFVPFIFWDLFYNFFFFEIFIYLGGHFSSSKINILVLYFTGFPNTSKLVSFIHSYRDFLIEENILHGGLERERERGLNWAAEMVGEATLISLRQWLQELLIRHHFKRDSSILFLFPLQKRRKLRKSFYVKLIGTSCCSAVFPGGI